MPTTTSGTRKARRGSSCQPSRAAANSANAAPSSPGVGVAGVAVVDRRVQRRRDRRGQRHVQLGDEGRQHVGRVAPPTSCCAARAAVQRHVVEGRARLVSHGALFERGPAQSAQERRSAGSTAHAMSTMLLRPARVFDGETLHEGWAVRIEGERIAAAGPDVGARTMPHGRSGPDGADADTTVVDLPGATLLPGLIDLHTHVLLMPYDRRSWDDQILRDHQALRVARAVPALARTLAAGFTTIRDLGTEGADEADVGLRRALEEGVIAGPRLVCVTRAIVAARLLRPGRLRAGLLRAARRGRGRRPGVDLPHGAAPDRARRGLDQSLRRLAPRPGRHLAPVVLAGRPGADRAHRGATPACRSPRTPTPPRPCGAPRWPAWRRSSTATRARPRSSR